MMEVDENADQHDGQKSIATEEAGPGFYRTIFRNGATRTYVIMASPMITPADTGLIQQQWNKISRHNQA